MYLLQSPAFKKFFESSVIFSEILKEVLNEAKGDVDRTVNEEQCRMVAQLCAETIIKHNLNLTQLSTCDLKIYFDNDNSREVRSFFSLLKKDARKDINSRALQIKINWLQSIFCQGMSRVFQESQRQMWNELKEEFLDYATKK